MSAKMKPQPGDWVRFYRGGVLVIGIVAYVKKAETCNWDWEVMTDVGSTTDDGVLEIRRAS